MTVIHAHWPVCYKTAAYVFQPRWYVIIKVMYCIWDWLSRSSGSIWPFCVLFYFEHCCISVLLLQVYNDVFLKSSNIFSSPWFVDFESQCSSGIKSFCSYDLLAKLIPLFLPDMWSSTQVIVCLLYFFLSVPQGFSSK